MSNIIIHNLYVNCYSVKLDIIICSMWYEIIVEYWILLEYRYDCLAWIVDHKNPLMSKMGKFIYFKTVPRGESYPRTNEIVCRSGTNLICISVFMLCFWIIYLFGIMELNGIWKFDGQNKHSTIDLNIHFFSYQRTRLAPWQEKRPFWSKLIASVQERPQ